MWKITVLHKPYSDLKCGANAKQMRHLWYTTLSLDYMIRSHTHRYVWCQCRVIPLSGWYEHRAAWTMVSDAHKTKMAGWQRTISNQHSHAAAGAVVYCASGPGGLVVKDPYSENRGYQDQNLSGGIVIALDLQRIMSHRICTGCCFAMFWGSLILSS